MITKGAIAASVEVINHPEYGQVVVKQYGPYEKSLAQQLIHTTYTYREELQKCRVVIPVNYETSLSDGMIKIIDAYSGEDSKYELNNGQSLPYKQKLVERMVDFLNHLPGDETTEVVGDFKPANFVWDGQDLQFIDHFLPRLWANDGLIKPYIESEDSKFFDRPALTYLWGDRRGQMGRLLGMIRLQHPDHYRYAVNYAQEQSPDKVSSFIAREAGDGFPSINRIYQTKTYG